MRSFPLPAVACPRVLRGQAASRPAHGFIRALALTLGLLAAQAGSAQQATSAEIREIRNVAELEIETADGAVSIIRSNEVVITVESLRTGATLELMRAVPGGTPAVVGASRCVRADGVFTLPDPSLPGASPASAGRSLSMKASKTFRGGEVVFVRVIDPDQNGDPERRESIRVEIGAPSSSDRETLEIVETGVDSGEFVGFVQTRIGPASPGNCLLDVAREGIVRSSYEDPDDGTDHVVAEALIAPVGVVFDATTGQPLDGVTVRLVTEDGAPAQVLGDDGTSAYPATVVTGAPVVDAGGTRYEFGRGAFRFPSVTAAGRYRILVEPPASYVAPSRRSVEQLQGLPTAPFRLLAESFGAAVAVGAGDGAAADIPLDPLTGALQLDKNADVAVARTGDLVAFTLRLRLRDANGALPGVALDDWLPRGFRYVRGSARRDGVRLDAIAADAATLRFSLGALAPNDNVEITYLTEVTANAPLREAVNAAEAWSTFGARSNRALATVRVVEDLFRTRATLVGRVAAGSCDAPAAPVAGVRLYMEDGRYVVTDRDGRYHFEAVRAGTHVVQVDRDSLPAGASVLDCPGPNRTAGTPHSQFVDLKGGALWRADFVLDGVVDLPATAAQQATRAEGAAAAPRWPDVERLAPGRDFVWPEVDAVPSIPAVKIAIRHPPGETVELTVNGRAVGDLNFDGRMMNGARTIALSRWRGVDLVEGDNRLEAVLRDAAGRETGRVVRSVHYSSGATRAELAPQDSALVADGRTPPVLAVRLFDRYDQPLRRGVTGTFEVLAPYRSQSEVDALDDNAVVVTGDRTPQWSVGEGGIARLALEPTTRAGWVTVRVRLNERRTEEIRAWLAPAPRDWILVGLAEGTAMHRKVSEHMQPIDDGDSLERDGRVAFFAKGTVRGEWLLTIAYDSAKDRSAARSRLQGVVDPDDVYTLYGDASQARDEAASQHPLFLKIERRQFVALFGDFETAFSTTELGRYTRTLSGVRVDHAGRALQWSAFAAKTGQVMLREDLPGDGTSGLYRLARAPLVANGEHVRIETRDRFESSRVLSARELTRHLDYSIDFDTGALSFREPVPSRDFDLNPVFIVVEYEVPEAARKRPTTAGGRAVAEVADGRLRLGATVVSEGGADERRAMGAVDARYRPRPGTEVRAEYARTDRAIGEQGGTGAWLVELTHAAPRAEWRLYAREQQEAFGLGQQATTESATRRVGVDGHVRLGERLQLRLQGENLERLDASARRTAGQAELRYEQEDWAAEAGLRQVSERRDGAATTDTTLLTLGADRRFFERRLLLRARAETALGAAQSADYPSRLTLGAEWRLTPATAAFVEHERFRGTAGRGDMTRVGLRSQPWRAATLESSLGQESSEAGSRLVSLLGLKQTLQLSERFAVDGGLDQSRTLSGAAAGVQPDYPASSGSTEDFVAGFVGATWRGGDWTAASRFELRNSDTDLRRTATLGVYRELSAGHAVSLALRDQRSQGKQGLDARLTDVAFGWAWRPAVERWMVLDKLELIGDRQGGAEPRDSRRIVNNLNVNIRLDPRTDLSLAHGARYGRTRVGDARYTGYTDLYGIELRRGLSPRWDVGVAGNAVRSWKSGTTDWSAGVDLGYALPQGLWISVGYNAIGFHDEDFSQSRYTARGPFIKLRLKLSETLLQRLAFDRPRRAAPAP